MRRAGCPAVALGAAGSGFCPPEPHLPFLGAAVDSTVAKGCAEVYECLCVDGVLALARACQRQCNISIYVASLDCMALS